MNFTRPLAVVTPTLDGDVLSVLAAGKVRLTGRAIALRISASQEGVRHVLGRLVGQGIVIRERAGNAHLHRLNRAHLAAPYIESLAMLRSELIDRLRTSIAAWRVKPAAAILFGSIARGDAGPSSDVDVLLIRARRIGPDQPDWRRQLIELEAAVTALTGNDTRVLEYARGEASTKREPTLRAAREHGITLYGPGLGQRGEPRRNRR